MTVGIELPTKFKFGTRKGGENHLDDGCGESFVGFKNAENTVMAVPGSIGSEPCKIWHRILPATFSVASVVETRSHMFKTATGANNELHGRGSGLPYT